MNNFPRKSLGFFPTPIMELSRLSKMLGGTSIFMKRDDMSGLALGGNKTRKLEYILADAIAEGCDSIITAGATQSNHCRQTAAAAAHLNMECHLLLGGQQPRQATGNLLLDSIFGCHIHWTGKHRKGEDIPKVFTKLLAAGKKPYVVPYGGSNELGALAFVAAIGELEAQIANESFSHIVFPSSSGGTQAGLILGKKLVNKNYQLIGINIDKGETDNVPLDEYIVNLVNQTAKMMGLNYNFSIEELILNSDYVGKGYGIVGKLEKEAISLTAQYEGILLDPVYSGRAMGGLIDMIRTGAINKNAKVLFWHTGGIPALFAYSDHLYMTDSASRILE